MRNISNYGDNNNFNEFHSYGSIRVDNLPIDQLADEYVIRKNSLGNQRKRRFSFSLLIILVSFLVLFILWYFFFYRNDIPLEFSRVKEIVFDNLVGFGLGLLLPLCFGAGAVGQLLNPSDVEIELKNEIEYIERLAKKRAIGRRVWRKAIDESFQRSV